MVDLDFLGLAKNSFLPIYAGSEVPPLHKVKGTRPPTQQRRLIEHQNNLGVKKLTAPGSITQSYSPLSKVLVLPNETHDPHKS